MFSVLAIGLFLELGLVPADQVMYVGNRSAMLYDCTAGTYAELGVTLHTERLMLWTSRRCAKRLNWRLSLACPLMLAWPSRKPSSPWTASPGCYADRSNKCYMDTTQETINRFLTSCKGEKNWI